MSTKILHNVIEDNDRKLYCDWLDKKDKLTDDRPNFVSKTPSWNSDNWPKGPIKKVLDNIHTEGYTIDSLIFCDISTAFKLHAHSIEGQKKSKVTIIPLKCYGPSSTVMFDNDWYGKEGRFSKNNPPPYEYTLEINGKKEHIEDIRQYKTDDKELQLYIDKLVENTTKTVYKRYSDYSQISNITNNAFDQDIHTKFLGHVPYEDLHGLSLEKVVEWQEGDAFTFDRTQLHCSSNTHDRKMFCTVFTLHT